MPGWWPAVPPQPPLGQQGAPASSLSDSSLSSSPAPSPPGPCWPCPQPDAVLKAFLCFSGISLNTVTDRRSCSRSTWPNQARGWPLTEATSWTGVSTWGIWGPWEQYGGQFPAPAPQTPGDPLSAPSRVTGARCSPGRGEPAAWRGPRMPPEASVASAPPPPARTLFMRGACVLQTHAMTTGDGPGRVGFAEMSLLRGT